ncbi:MAG: Ribosome hibernation promotion factor [Chlamydiia bacterium]|nr:Ribosome hibernation promotion factor [Chlamydiia bacterium]MCH9615065.1 Ribosome hibernation promotion factor [Chlamydiia bacterium]MCH9628613.1 Ribosome hibernation promotion factor [Chlamydiia bacterium]
MSENYRVSVVGKNIEVTNAMRDYFMDKLEKTEKLSTDLIHVDATVEVHKLDHEVTIIMKFSHYRIKVHAVTGEMYSAIDKAFDKLRSKLRRWKSKIQSHHAKGLKMTEMEVELLEHEEKEVQALDQDIIEENNTTLDAAFARPPVVRVTKAPLKTLTLDEAWMKMELTDDLFMVFKSEEDRTIKVMYRRANGGYAIMNTQ